jgi:hypothetical protein
MEHIYSVAFYLSVIFFSINESLNKPWGLMHVHVDCVFLRNDN